MITCAFCNKVIEWEGQVFRHDTCPNCSRDLHCCIQCKFYDLQSYNQCKETIAERVVDKERENFCDYFVLRGGDGNGRGKEETAKKALEDLFKKKD
ncbi:MAG: hypothetical protein U9R17_17425 [Thermodesulfobacteriota bacterium]|nr:hypothetical protein [Thermodesulfobacteriota bacterium]